MFRRSFMYVGAFCFVVALGGEVYLKTTANAGSHQIVLSVIPIDMKGSGFPEPTVKKDNVEINYKDNLIIDGKTSLTIDVNAAVTQFQTKVSEAKSASAEAAAATRLATRSQEQVAQLKTQSEEQALQLNQALQTLDKQTNVLRTVSERTASLENSIAALSNDTETIETLPSLDLSNVLWKQTIDQLSRDLSVIDGSLNSVGIMMRP